MENNNQQSFWQFSDQLRVQTPQNLPLNDSIWSTKSVYKRTDERRNMDIDKNTIEYLTQNNKTSDINTNWKSGSNDLRGFGAVGSKSTVNLNPPQKFNTPFNDTWKFNSVNGEFNKGIYSSPVKNYGYNFNLKQGSKNKGIIDEDHQIPKGGKKNRKNQNHNHQKNNEDDKNILDKRFKTLPPAEALPRNETIGGYIFV